MSTKSDMLAIGRIHKPHGVKGELKMQIEEDFIPDMDYLTVLFLEVKGQPVPYFVEEIRGAGAQLIKLEDVHTKEAAQPLAGATIYVRKSDLQWDEEDIAAWEAGYEGYEGYTLYGEVEGIVGVITQIIELPQQDLAIVNYQEREVMIPLHDDLVTDIDDEAQTLTLQLPAGILDLDDNETPELEDEEE